MYGNGKCEKSEKSKTNYLLALSLFTDITMDKNEHKLSLVQTILSSHIKDQ